MRIPEYRCFSKKNGMNYNQSYFILALAAYWNGDRSETFMQFIGRLDKSGRKIWEGDIVTCLGGHPKEVFWDADQLGWRIWRDKSVEILGNVHEHPELLKNA